MRKRPAVHGLLVRLDPYLLSILSTVALASVLPARGPAAGVVSDLAQAAIALLFFLYGAKISGRAAMEGFRSWRLHATVASATFVLFPLIGFACRPLVPSVLTPQLYFGVMFLCLLPSTVQSSIAFTSIARGNVAAAICSASFSNLAGVVLTPLLAALFLGSKVNVSPASVLRIAAQLLLPFLLGQLVQRWVGPVLVRHRRATDLVDRGSVLLVIYSAFSAGVVSGVWHEVTPPRLLALLAVDATILAVVLAATTHTAKWLGFNAADQIVVIFCGSKKSIATGIPMAAVLFAGRDVALIVLPAMLFHQIQLMVCAVLARRFARRDQAQQPTAPVGQAAVAPSGQAGPLPGLTPGHGTGGLSGRRAARSGRACRGVAERVRLDGLEALGTDNWRGVEAGAGAVNALGGVGPVGAVGERAHSGSGAMLCKSPRKIATRPAQRTPSSMQTILLGRAVTVEEAGYRYVLSPWAAAGGRWRLNRFLDLGGRFGRKACRQGRVQQALVVGDERSQRLAGAQGRAQMDRVQATDGDRLCGLGQEPDGRVQTDQVNLVKHCRESGHGVGRVPGQRPERLDFRQYGADPACLGPLVEPVPQRRRFRLSMDELDYRCRVQVDHQRSAERS